MSVRCPTCSRVNPANAAYCYYDGRGLNRTTPNGSVGRATQDFPYPFSFSDGQGCSNFNQLVVECNHRWNEARNNLLNGTWKSFFAAIGRADLAALAVQSARESDPDVGLCLLLEKLPADAEALRPPRLALSSTEENLGALEPGKDYKIELAIANQGMLMLRGSAMTDCDWLSFGDQKGSFSTKLFQTRDTYSLSLRVLGSKFRAGKAPLEGQVVIDTNGGRQTVVVRATVPIRPFPKLQIANDVLAGAASPREIAVKAKAHPKEAADLFEQGAVKAWYQSNGWMYPVRSTQARGKSSVQQFFEALGLSKPPRLEINTEKIECEGHVGESLTREVVVHTTESKYVYAEAHSNQPWVKVLPAMHQGKSVTVPLCIEIPARQGETLEAVVTFLGNGQQRFVVPISLTIAAQTFEQEEQAARRSRWIQWAWAGSVVFLGLVIALAVVITHRRSRSDNSSEVTATTEPQPEPRLPKVEHWWDDIQGTHLTESVAALKKAARKDQAIFERIESKVEGDRLPGYQQLADKLGELARKPQTREALGQFVKECCVYEPSDINIDPLLEGLKSRFPLLRKAEDVEIARFWVGFVSDAVTHEHCREFHPDRSNRLASDLGNVLELKKNFDASIPREAFKENAERALAEYGYRYLVSMAVGSIELALDMRKVLIARLGQRFRAGFRDNEDLKLLNFLERQNETALHIVQIVNRWTEDNSDTVRKKLVEMLRSRLPKLNPDQIKELIPLLRHKDPKIVLAVLKEVKDRKKQASDVAAELLNLIQSGDPKVRDSAVEAFLAVGPAVETAVPELSQRLRLLLTNKDKSIVLAGLRIVQARKAKAAELAETVISRLDAGDAEVRAAAANALRALGPTVVKPHSDEMLKRWREENDPNAQRTLRDLLVYRIQKLKREQMKRELPPLLHDTDAKIVLVALEAVQKSKAEAKDVAEDVANLLTRNDQPKVYEQALAALTALGPAAEKALDKLFEILEKTGRSQRMPLALTIADIVEAKDALYAGRLVRFLLEGLNPKLLEKDSEGANEEKINQALLKIGQPAVDGCVKILEENLKDKDTTDSIERRKKLYTTLAKLGNTCKSQKNYDTLDDLRRREGLRQRPNKEVNEAVKIAWKKMEP